MTDQHSADQEIAVFDLSGRGSFLGPIGYSYGMNHPLSSARSPLLSLLLMLGYWLLTRTSIVNSYLRLYTDRIRFSNMYGNEKDLPFSQIVSIKPLFDVLLRPAVTLRTQSGKRYWFCFTKQHPEHFKQFLTHMQKQGHISIDPRLLA
jgi:hypothetical protein